MIYLLNGRKIDGQFSTANDTTYPGNWLDLSTSEDRKALGIIALEEIRPEINEKQTYDGTYVDDLVKMTRTYNYHDL